MTVLPPPLGPAHALFLDFDGTLAGLQDDPDTVFISAEQKALLSELAARIGGAVAIVTGRDVRDIAARVPRDLWRAGNHGLSVVPPWQDPDDLPEAPDAVHAACAEAVRLDPRLRIENKGPVLAIHTRPAPERVEDVLSVLSNADVAALGYRIERGNGVIELKPRLANKGLAINSLLTQTPFTGRVPVFVGDDTTDEDGFAAVLDRGGLAVKVGVGDSIAPWRMDGPRDVWGWLEESCEAVS